MNLFSLFSKTGITMKCLSSYFEANEFLIIPAVSSVFGKKDSICKTTVVLKNSLFSDLDDFILINSELLRTNARHWFYQM